MAASDPPRPRLRSPSDLGAAAEGVKAGVLEERDADAIGPGSIIPAIHAITMATPDLAPQPPVTKSDTANAGPSLRKLVTERTEGHLPPLWHGTDNVV